MESKRLGSLREAAEQLRLVLETYNAAKPAGTSQFLAMIKAFEVILEYAWKEFKREVEDSGLEAASPKDAVRQAAKLKLIKDAELWIDAINTRNMSVHDYFSSPPEDIAPLAARVLKEVDMYLARAEISSAR